MNRNRRIVGGLEVGLGVALLVFAAAMSSNDIVPAVATQPVFATYAVLWGAWAVRVGLEVKPDVMSERYVVISGVVVTVPSLLLGFFFLQSDPATAIVVPFFVAVAFQSLFKSVEERTLSA